jgi:hypothetical protein
MLAEAFDEEIKTFYSAKSLPNSPLKLDILSFFRLFIMRKYDIYEEEKVLVMNNLVAVGQRECELTSVRKDHQLLALKVLFTEKQVALFQNNRECSF